MREVYSMTFTPSSYESKTVSSAAVGVTAAKCRLAAYITVETNPIRYRIDGTDPTTAEGHLVAANEYIWLANETAISNLKMIATGADATVRVTHFG